MASKRYEDFIEKLLTDTKSKKITWYYLDSNEKLCSGMGWSLPSPNPILLALSGSHPERPNVTFNTDDSFYAKIGSDSFVVLFSPASERLPELYVVPNGFKRSVKMSSQEYGTLITRLSNLLSSLFPSGDQAISDYLNKM